ncbi:TRAP transporter small permease [Bacteroidota bacterium]
MTVKKSNSWLIRLFRIIYHHTEGFLLLVLTILLVTDVLLGILARYVHFEIVFATELGKYLFIWLCAIGISAAAKDNQHVRINFIVEKLGVDRKITWILSQLLFLLFSLFFFFWGIQLAWMHFDMDKSAMGFIFPMYIFTAAIPVGFALTSIRLILDIAKCIKSSDYTPWIMQTQTEQSGISDDNNDLLR